jgi:hypothetical protein
MGGLLGDVFYHNLPHLADCSENQTLTINTIIIVGVMSFFVLEKLTHKYLTADE